MFKKTYQDGLERLVGRKLTVHDGIELKRISAAEQRLKLSLPLALSEYYELAGNLAINKEHNLLYTPEELNIIDGKLVFMEENQVVVFWGMDLEELQLSDPRVFQAVNETGSRWYSERMTFSKFILKMWRWQKKEELKAIKEFQIERSHG